MRQRLPAYADETARLHDPWRAICGTSTSQASQRASFQGKRCSCCRRDRARMRYLSREDPCSYSG